MDISIIIVNFNVKYFLEQCLFSVVKACRNLEAEILVADNASTDGSRQYLESKFPSVHFIWNSENMGFGKANNAALKKANGKYILFLNPDTIIAEDTLEMCLAFADGKKDFGGLGIHMIDGSGVFLKESKRSFPSTPATFFKMTGIHYLFPRSQFFSSYYAAHLPEKENNAVDVLAGAFMMIEKKILEITGGFDEDFFMYGEDIDLSFRIKKYGFQNYYYAGSTIIHFKGESTQRRSAEYIYHFYKAMKLFVKKHGKGKSSDALSLLGIAAAKKAALAKLLFKKNSKELSVNPELNSTGILCRQQQFNEILHLVKFSKQPVLIKGRIALDHNDPDYSIGKVNELDEIIKRKLISRVILMESEISFKEIISLVGKFKQRLTFLFHAHGSNSIVGSNKKNEKGIFISKEG
ncbi:MAG: glycosyltransferase family 2 protein [Ferruginibacter sp.]